MSVVSIDHDVQLRIRKIVCEVLEIEDRELTESSSFTDDHGVDSMAAIELLAKLEREFDILIDQDQLAELTTLDGTTAVVATAIARR
jgi:acyl carrier protein